MSLDVPYEIDMLVAMAPLGYKGVKAFRRR